MEQSKTVQTVETTEEKEKIKFTEKLAYFFGGWNASMLAFVLASYLMYFYTDIFGISAAVVGTLLLVGRIWDGVNDVIIGYIADNTKTRWGKVRPFFLWFAIPTGILFALMYQVPNLSMAMKIVYAFATYLLFDTVYTCVYIPNAAILTCATKNPKQRVSLNFFNATGSMIANIGIPLAFFGVAMAFGGGDFNTGFPKLMIVFGVIATAIMLYQFAFTHERYQPVKEEKIKIAEGLKFMFQNKYVIIILIVSFLFTLGQFFFTSVMAYYGKLVLNDISFPTKIFAVYAVVAIVSIPIMNALAKKFSIKKIYIIAQLIGLSSAIARMFLPFDNPLVMLILVGFAGVQGAANFLPAVFLADSYEYGEWKFGKRIVGISVSVGGFLNKLSMALASAVAAWMLAWAGYTADSTLTPRIMSILRTNMIYLPIIMFIIGIIVFAKVYDLEKLMPQVRKEMKELREENQ